MNNLKALLITGFCITIGTIEAENGDGGPPMRSRKDLSVSYTEERVNGDTFVHRQDWDHVTGERTNRWLVNGKEVDQETYTKLLRKAEKEHLFKEQSYYERIKSERHERTQQIAALGALRLLDMAVTEIESTLKKFDDKSLKPYFTFGQQSIPSQEILDRLQDELLPQARKLARAATPRDLTSINQLIAELDGLSYKLSDFFLGSIEHAIKQADDPQLLKKWLSLVA